MPDAPLIKRFLQHQSEFMSYLMAITRNVDAAEEIFQNAAAVVMEQALADAKQAQAALESLYRQRMEQQPDGQGLLQRMDQATQRTSESPAQAADR